MYTVQRITLHFVEINTHPKQTQYWHLLELLLDPSFLQQMSVSQALCKLRRIYHLVCQQPQSKYNKEWNLP